MKTLRIIARILLWAFALVGVIAIGAYAAIQLHLTNVAGTVDTNNRYLNVQQNAEWMQGENWDTLKTAILKNKDDINKAAADSGVPARLIVAQLVTEQLRLFNSDRESFKKYFQPFQILGIQSLYSWGVMGIKEDTAIQVEQHLKDKTSPYYLGPSYEHILDYSSASLAAAAASTTGTSSVQSEARFIRLTTNHQPYYAFLYSGLFLRQVTVQWKNAGFDISKRPEILSTLYNIGFSHSTPNANPQVGGAEITVSGYTYSFGELAYAFYMSDQLLDVFPR